MVRVLPLLLALVSACAGPATPGRGQGHGVITSLSARKSAASRSCEHRVPREVCTRCDPQLVPMFKRAGDWCGEHDVPESQCFLCHPDLTFDPWPEPPPGADVRRLAERGEDVPALAAHAVPGKVTLFDFYADWCMPCRQIDAHVYALLRARSDIAHRKLNVVSWETPLARRHLAQVPTLPYVVVYGKDGKLVGAVSGLDLAALDRAIAAGSSR